MSLAIIASREIGFDDPYKKYSAPNSNDFAYRNNHKQFKDDLEEFERLCEKYEKLKEEAWICDYYTGYINFNLMRRKLVELIGFGRFIGGATLGEYSLHYKDIEDAQDLKEFFLHSDCDGELGVKQIETLNKHIQKYNDVILNFRDPNIKEFAEFVKKSVEEKACWKFV